MIGQVYRWHRPLTAFAGAMAVLAVVATIGLFTDDRILVGVPIWLKPLKFSISFVLYGFTLAWMLSLLRRGRRVGWWAGTVIAVASVIEMTDATLFSIMGSTIVVLWLTNALIAVLLLMDRVADPAMSWAIRLGFGVMLIGLGLGFLMVTPTPAQQQQISAGIAPAVVGAHSVGVPDGGPSMPLTGWSTAGGDLRIPHFIGIHALQLLPLLVLLLMRRFPMAVQVRLVFVAAGTYAGLLGLTSWQALRGQPLVHPDGLTLGALVALLAVAGTTAVLLTRRTPVPAVA